jgi:tetratricopeptide (TPR) repeat protein
MSAMRRFLVLAAAAILPAALGRAETPLAKPLADFDKMVSEMKASGVTGEPIRVGTTVVVPFAAMKFGLGAGGGTTAFGGGMGGKIVPLGAVIVEGDEVRLEQFPEPDEKPTLFHQILQAIRERKVVFMVNGLNIGHAGPGAAQELAPLISEMMGQTTILVNGLNLGSLSAPGSTRSAAHGASLGALKELYEAKKYEDALAMANTLSAQDPKSAEMHVWKGRIMGRLAQGNPVDMMKYGPGAKGEFEQAVTLDPSNPDAHMGRGMARLMAPPAFGGDVNGAIEDFEAANAKKPSPEGYYYLGEALRRNGSNDKAAAAYKKALELRPDYPEASQALAAIH